MTTQRPRLDERPADLPDPALQNIHAPNSGEIRELPEVLTDDKGTVGLLGQEYVKLSKMSEMKQKALGFLLEAGQQLALGQGAIMPREAVVHSPNILEEVPEDAPTDTAETVAEASKLLEKQRFVKEAPRFRDQVTDTTRMNVLDYVASRSALGQWTEDPIYDSDSKHVTEHEALVGLEAFLENVADESDDHSYDSDLIKKAQGMLDTLTFIGQKEYAEATVGLAKLWTDFLDADPDNQICVLTKISRGSKTKSDKYLFEEILKHFSEEQIEMYKHRMTVELEDVTAPPEKTRVVVLDDWTISGSQIKAAYDLIEHSPLTNAYKDAIEVNLLVSSRKRIAQGFEHDRHTTWDPSDDIYVPLRAYYVAHESPDTAQYGNHITGYHSSVDYDFENEISKMVSFLNTGSLVGREKMPPLTNIRRVYRNMKAQRINEIATAKPQQRRHSQGHGK
jgi:hypothetical protein